MSQTLSKNSGFLKAGFPLLWIILVGIWGGCATALDPVDNAVLAREKFREAMEFGSINMHEKQITALKEAIGLAQEDPEYRAHLGGAYLQDGQFEQAEKEFLDILNIDKRYKTAYHFLGQLAMRKQNWEKAVEYFSEELKLPGAVSPHQVYNWLALSYYNLGRIKMAEQEWKNAIHIKDHAGIRLNLALLYKNQEQFARAMESLKKAVVLNPKFHQAHYEIALLYLREKKMNRAITHFERAVRLDPKSTQAEASREYLNLLRQEK